MSAQPPENGHEASAASVAISPLTRMLLALSFSKEAFRRPIRPADWLIPLLLVLAFAIGGAYLLQDLAVEQWQETTNEQIENSERLTPEERETQRTRLMEGGMEKMVRLSTTLGPLVAIPFACLLAALFLTLIIGFAMGGAVRFADMWPVAILAWTPHLIRTVLITALAKASGSLSVHLGPAALIQDDKSALAGILGVLDLFDLWMLGIHIVGVGALTSLTKGKARAAVLVLWISYWIVAMALVFLGRKMQGLA